MEPMDAGMMGYKERRKTGVLKINTIISLSCRFAEAFKPFGSIPCA
ncbi:MAG: hypothetical protein ISS67_07665 [Desulfobacterales bacterium]|nr:hypothetical protein [Desulfobacterales bacterium]